MVVLHIIRHYFTQGNLRKVFTKSVTRHFGGHKFTQWCDSRNLQCENTAVDAAVSRSPSSNKISAGPQTLSSNHHHPLYPVLSITNPPPPPPPNSQTNTNVSTTGHFLRCHAANKAPGTPIIIANIPCSILPLCKDFTYKKGNPSLKCHPPYTRRRTLL